MISAPSEMRWNGIPAACITTKVIASTSGTHSATTMPVRKPRLRKLTASTMASASPRASMNSSNERATTVGWSATWLISTPIGSSAFSFFTSACSALPISRLLPSLVMEMARPMTGLPLKFISCDGGSL